MIKRNIVLAILVAVCAIAVSCLPPGYTTDNGTVIPLVIPASSNTTSTGNVTSTGTTGHIPYFQSSTNLDNTSAYYDNGTGFIGIFDNTPTVELDVDGRISATGDINSDSDINAGNDVNVTNDLDVTDDADIGGDLDVTGNITVGGTVDGVDVANHSSRHEWGGADELYMVDLSTFKRKDTFEGPLNQALFLLTQTGGRGTLYNNYTNAYGQTGNVSGDVIGGASFSSYYIDYNNAGFRLRGYFHWQPNTTTNKSEMWIGALDAIGTFPTTTGNHIGFRLIETAGAGDGHATLYASNGNGVAGTQTSILTNVGQYDGIWCGFVYTKVGATGTIYYYLSSDYGNTLTLVATHNTNIPSATAIYPALWAKTTENVIKDIVCWSWRWTLGE